MRAYLTARVLLAPLLAGQAVVTRRRVRELPEAAGAREGQAGEGPMLRLLIIGDSSAAGVGAASQDHALLGQVVSALGQHFTVDYTLIAESGARTVDARAWLRDHSGAYDVAIVALGVNDVTKLTPLDRFLTEQSALWQSLQRDFGARQVLGSAMPPVGMFRALPQPLRWAVGQRAAIFDRALRPVVADAANVDLVGFTLQFDPDHMADDGFHPGPKVYADWGQAIAQQIIASRQTLDGAAAAP